METIFFDLETGGVTDEPSISLAAVAVDDALVELDHFEAKLKFDPASCNPEALKINGYKPEDWNEAIEPAVAAARFAAWSKRHATLEMISKRTGAPYKVGRLAGYNALTFDLPRLRAMFGESFFPFSYQVRDILQRAMFWFDEHQPAAKPKDMKLTTLCQYFSIPVEGAHEALTDVRLTVALYRRLIDSSAGLSRLDRATEAW